MVDRKNKGDDDGPGSAQMTQQLQEMLDKDPPEYVKVLRVCGTRKYFVWL